MRTVAGSSWSVLQTGFRFNLPDGSNLPSLSRFESLEPEMNSQASRVAVVNQVARQLIHCGHPSEREIKAQQDKLNTR